MNNLPVLWKPETPEMVRVTTAAHPLQVSREFIYVKSGTSVWDVVQSSIPEVFRDHVFVTIDGEFIARDEWKFTPILVGDIIVIRAVPMGGGGGIGKILKTVFTVALIAVAIFQPELFIGVAGLIGVTGATAGAVGLAIVGAVGNLLLSALIPPSSMDRANSNSSSGALPEYTFGVGGIQNAERPYGSVPRIYGRTLMTPPKGAHSYTVISNHNQYLYALFDLGPGPIKITDIKIGTTPIDDFADVQYEIREGRSTDADITLYNNAVHQTPLSIGMFALSDTATQTTPINVSNIAIDITAPGGLFTTGGDGKLSQFTVTFNLTIVDSVSRVTVFNREIDLFGTTNSSVGNTYVVGVAEGSVGDALPVSQYDVTLTRTASAPDPYHGTSNCYWSSIRSWGPFDGPLLPQNHAKIALVIRATEQLNGDITSLNCIAQSYVQVWDGATLTEQLNTHPAWAALDILTGTSNARALDPTRVDLDGLLEWAETYPTAEFNYVFSNRTTIWQALKTVGSAGRAVPVVRDGQYSFVFDRTQSNPVQMFTSRNISDFEMNRIFLDEVDGMEIRYVSETLGWQQHSIYLYAAGITEDTANFNFVSALDLVGVTSDDWAYKIGSYFFAASVLRTNTYSFKTDLDHLACNPGDRVLVQHDIISSGITSGRIVSISRDGSGNINGIGVDVSIIGDGTSTYKMTVRTQYNGLYTLSILVDTVADSFFTMAVNFHDAADTINIGDLFSISTTAVVLLDALVKTITPSTDFAATVTLIDYAPTVHSGDVAVVPPVVNDRIKQFQYALNVSSVVILSMTADEDSSQLATGGSALPRIHGGFVTNMDGIPPSLYEVQFKVSTDTGYTKQPILPAGSNEFFIPIQFTAIGLTYDVRLRGTNASQTNPGPWANASIEITDYLAAPPAPASLTITPTIAGVSAAIVPAAGRPPAKYRLYINDTFDFSTAELATEGTSSPLSVNGLDATILYYFWATSINEYGVESSPIGPISGLPLPVGTDHLTPDVTDFLNFLGEAARDHSDSISDLAQSMANVAFGTKVDFQNLQGGYIAADSTLFTNLTNGYTSAITTATGPSSSIVTSITALQATLTGYSGSSTVASAVSALQTQVTTDGTNIASNASAITGVQSALTGYTGASAVSTAITSLQTQITTNGTNITSNSASITSLNNALTGYSGSSAVASAFTSLNTSVTSINGTLSSQASSISSVASQVGNMYSSGLFRVFTSSTPSGADARIELAVAASSGGSAYGAAVYLDAMTGGTSRITCIANEFFITDGTNNHSPFFYTGGALYLDQAYIQALTATKIVSGTLDASVIAAGSLDASKITAGTITSSLLTSGVINVGTLIAGNIVTTSHMTSNSITNSQATTGSSALITNSGYTTLASITVVAAGGGSMLISFTDYITWSTSGPRGFYQIIDTSSNVLMSVGYGGGSCPDFICTAGSGLDSTYSSGSNTYYLQATWAAGNQPTSVLPTLVVTELKR